MSYYYLRKKSKKKLEELIYRTQPEDVVYFIDSGAFTFIEHAHKTIDKDGPKKFLDHVSQYVEEYCEFLQRYQKRLWCCVEMDIDEVLEDLDTLWDGSGDAGKWTEAMHLQSKDYYESSKRGEWSGRYGYSARCILDWRQQIQSTGVPTVLPWHTQRQWKGWLDQCKTHDYNGIGSSDTLKMPQWFRYINEARKTKSKVHGFAVTKPEFIRRFPLHSVDSTSWLDGSKFGTTFAYQSGRIRYYTYHVKENVRRRLRRVYEAWGVDLAALDADKGEAVDEINCIAWLQYAEALHTMPNKDYWETEINDKPLGFYGPPRGEASPDLTEDLGDIEAEAEEKIEEMPENPPKNERPKVFRIGGEPVDTTAIATVEANPLRILDNGAQLQKVALGPMKCSQCYIADSCEFMQEGADCYFHLDNQFATPQDFIEGFRVALGIQMQRSLHARLIEKRDGGVIDRQLSSELNRFTDMMLQFKELVAPREEPSLVVTAKGDGPITQILSSVFGKKSKAKEPKEP